MTPPFDEPSPALAAPLPLCALAHLRLGLRASAVQGESIPQLKDPVSVEKKTAATSLDIKTAHRVHTLYSGTLLMQHSHQAHAAPAAAEGEGGEGGGAAAKDDAVLPSCIGVPLPPDKGCTCYVLATAFSSSQGELMRMIEFSTAKVRRPRSCALLPLAPPFALASRRSAPDLA